MLWLVEGCACLLMFEMSKNFVSVSIEPNLMRRQNRAGVHISEKECAPDAHSQRIVEDVTLTYKFHKILNLALNGC